MVNQKKLKFEFNVIFHREGDLIVAYLKKYDMTAYGKTEEEIQEMFSLSIDEILKQNTKKINNKKKC